MEEVGRTKWAAPLPSQMPPSLVETWPQDATTVRQMAARIVLCMVLARILSLKRRRGCERRRQQRNVYSKRGTETTRVLICRLTRIYTSHKTTIHTVEIVFELQYP